MYKGFDAMLKEHNPNVTFNGDDLMKALYSTNSGAGGIQQGPLTLENLDGVMTEVLVTNKHFKLFDLFPKVPSANAYFEYNTHKGFGSRRAPLGFAEGGGPTGGISAFLRSGEYIKYLGVRGGVTDQMLRAGQAGGIFEDPETRENKDRTLELLEAFERIGVFGNKSVKDKNGVETNCDGLLTLLMSKLPANVVDMAGKAFGFDNIDNSSEALITKGKQPSMDGYKCLMSPHVAKGINKQYQDRNIQRTGSTDSFAPGFKVPSYAGQFGEVTFDHSILLQEVEAGLPSLTEAGAAVKSHADAPGAVTISTEPTARTGDIGFPASGTYYYSIAAFNDSGEGAATVSASVALNGSTQSAYMVATAVSGATGYRVYRGKSATITDHRLIATIPVPASGSEAGLTTLPTGNQYYATYTSAGLKFVDVGGWTPTNNVTTAATDGLAIFIKPDPKDICLAQLAPLHKKVLPPIDTLNPFILMLYVTLILKAPERIRIYKNCGVYNGSNLDDTK